MRGYNMKTFMLFIVFLTFPTILFAQSTCDRNPYGSGCIKAPVQSVPNCSATNVYAEFDLRCWNIISEEELAARDKVAGLSLWDGNYHLPYCGYYERDGNEIALCDKGLMDLHYKACRRTVGNLLGED